MSADDVSKATAEADERPRQGSGRVIGTFLVLCVFAGLLAFIAQGFLVMPVDGVTKQHEYFGERELPFGLELADASRLPGGDALVRFTRTAPGKGPEELVFIEYRSHAAVETLFRPAMMGGMGGMSGMGDFMDPGTRMKQWEADPSFAWHTTMKRDEIAWGEWRSKLWIERAFAEGGGWRDEARVDLSGPTRALVLFAHWPTGEAVDERALTELLSTLELGSPPAAAH